MGNSTDVDDAEKLICAEVVLRTSSGDSLMKKRSGSDAESLARFKANNEVVKQAIKQLSDRGFKVIASSPFGISIMGSKALFKEHFQTEISIRVKRASDDKIKWNKSHPLMDEPPIVPQELATIIETIYIPPPAKYHIKTEPRPFYWHLELPDDVCRILKADKAHARGFLGRGIKVAMVDTGLEANHEYFTDKDYNITIHSIDGQIVYDPKAQPPINTCLDDNYGHGTSMAANLLAIAPKCDFHLFIDTSQNSMNANHLAAFRNARQESGVKVISCSWGYDLSSTMAGEITLALRDGIAVVFSCGNTTGPDFPGCMPEVISVGGVDLQETGDLIASSFASSGENPNYVGRKCPDVCGLCGPAPWGLLIHMPTQPNSDEDQKCSGKVTEDLKLDADHTPENDGWVIASGTSSAAAQVAGGVALLLNADQTLTPDKIKQVLEKTATDIRSGKSATNADAAIDLDTNTGYDAATGFGLVNLEAAVNSVAPYFWVLRLYYAIRRFWRIPPWWKRRSYDEENASLEVNL